MRTKVFLNRVPTDWKTDFDKAKDYFARKGVTMDFDFVQYDYKNLSFVEVNLFPQGRRVFVQPYMANVLPVDKSYDFTIFAFNQEEFPLHGIPQGICYEHENGIYIDVGFHRSNPKDLSFVEICHELMHGIVKKARKSGIQIQDVMDSYHNNFFLETENSNFGQQWKLLKPYLDTLKPKANKLNHFTPKEVKGLKEDFAQRLDIGRAESNIPWVLTSTLRTPAKNKAVGGSPTSAHLDGTGADVRARNWVEVGKIVDGARKAGITGITVYRDSKHVHLDMKGYRLEVK